MVMLLLTELLGLTQVVHSPHSFLSFDPNRHSPFFAFAVAAMFALHALFHGRQLHLAAAFVIGLILATLHAMVFFTTRQGWLSVVSTGLYYLGAGSFLILSWLAWRCRHSAQGASFVETLKAGMLLPLFVVTSWSWLEASYRLRTNTFDAVLYRFDDSLGFHASAIAGRLFAQTPLLGNVSGVVYAGLPLFAAIQYGLQCRCKESPANILKVFLVIALAGFAVYFLFPAAGPRYLVGDLFPQHMPGVEGMPLDLAPLGPAYRNAMPSLHMAWALALCLGARQLSLSVRIAFALVAGVTALATLGLGEHYLIDLVVAFPFALTAWALCVAQASHETRRAAAIGIALVVAWLAYLSTGAAFFADAGRIHLILMAATIGWVAVLARRLSVTRQ